MKVVNITSQDYVPVRETAPVAAQPPADKNQAPVIFRDGLLPEEKNISREELSNAVEKMQRAVGIFDKHFKFRIHDKTHRVMVQVVDNRTNEIVNEIPPEKILDMVADLQSMVGIVIDKKA